MHCSPRVGSHVNIVLFFSLKAFETLVRDIIKYRHFTGVANVKITQVHRIPQYAQEISMYNGKF